jgi:taurine dioxygenase
LNDYGDQRRVVRRVTLAGEIPIGVDGQASRSLHKEVRRSAEEVKKLYSKAA